jgi:hypothetical protein
MNTNKHIQALTSIPDHTEKQPKTWMPVNHSDQAAITVSATLAVLGCKLSAKMKESGNPALFFRLSNFWVYL